jgi:hypothetical protein
MRIIDKEKGLYISDTFVIQLRGRVIYINNIPVEFESAEKAKKSFDTLVDKLQKIEEGQEDSVVVEVSDTAVIAYGTIVEFTPAAVKINGIPIYVGYKEAKPLFEEIKEQLSKQKLDNTLNPTVAPLILKKQGFITVENEFGGNNSNDNNSGSSGGILAGDWCPNQNLYLCQADTKPTIKVNPPTTGAIWIDTKDADIYFCVDNTQDKNVWISIKGDIVKPLDQPLVTLTDITKATMVDAGKSLDNGYTLVFYGEGWQSGNYHNFFRSYDNNGNWKNDAYYGNGFTVRKNCPFGYNYLNTPPSGEPLVAIFRFDPNGYLIRFYKVNTSVAVQTPPTKVYETSGGINVCPGTTQFCIYASDCNGSSPLGGTIYKFELYDTPIPDSDLDAIANRIVNS